jgi:hypothetical protein
MSQSRYFFSASVPFDSFDYAPYFAKATQGKHDKPFDALRLLRTGGDFKKKDWIPACAGMTKEINPPSKSAG